MLKTRLPVVEVSVDSSHLLRGKALAQTNSCALAKGHVRALNRALGGLDSSIYPSFWNKCICIIPETWVVLKRVDGNLAAARHCAISALLSRTCLANAIYIPNEEGTTQNAYSI